MRPSEPNENGGFVTFFHYPGQWITSSYTNKFQWSDKTEESSPYTMEFRIQAIQTMKIRNRKQKPCHENMRSFDTLWMNNLMLQVGCRPPHFNTTLHLPLCNKKQDMYILRRQPSIFILDKYYLPCKSIQNLRYDYYERDEKKCK